MAYKFLEHTAEVKFHVEGSSLERAFVDAAMALGETIVGKQKINNKISKEIEVKGKDNERLLYNFLEEILFLLDSEDFVISSVNSIKIESGSLVAVVLGDKASEYDFSNSVKAITYSEMKVVEEAGKTIIEGVFDV
tara:strand:- start:40 stop:447 length:408 start_codon:yes stop_codon:yes gene_type:complete